MYINAEGYNTPPLTRLEFDIESLDPIVANKISEFVYQYCKKQFGIDAESEYLTYNTCKLYFKEENKSVRKENDLNLENKEENSNETEQIVNYGNQLFNIFQSLKDNGNCKIYPKNCNKNGQVIYSLTLNENGKLTVTSELRKYDFNLWGEKDFDISMLDYPTNIIKFTSESNINLVNIFHSYECNGGIRVSTHKNNKKVDTTLALNELYSYMNQMFSVFDYENTENWLDDNGLLAQWVKGDMNSRLNILLKNIKPYSYDSTVDKLFSYEEILGNLISSSQRFLIKQGKAYQDWYRIKNGEYNIVNHKESGIKK